MTWRKEPGAYRSTPYTVLMQGPVWVARLSRSQSFPLHLGKFQSAQQAMAFCEGHRRGMEEDELLEGGFGEK